MYQEHSDRHVTRLGETDVYLISQPAILTGDELDRLSLVLRVPRPVYPPELVHRLVNEAAYERAAAMVRHPDSPHPRLSAA